MKKYDPSKIEKKWQKYWEDQELHVTKDEVKGKENLLKLVEFPYPSGNLHIGHWYAFGTPDIYARYKKMQGYNVMFPFGVDAFGLPAENAAIKHDINPAEWTQDNVKYMLKQLRTMGSMLDFSRFVNTTDPEYYKWTQWIFLQLQKNDLAYRAKTTVNWCPNDNTVLANEQVVDGHCERCDAEVEQREREQWMYRITKFADALIDDLDTIDWPEYTKLAQRNWIGRKHGINNTYNVVDSNETITCFTTAPVNFGATFIVLGPEHPIIDRITTEEQKKAVEEYVKASKKKSALDRMAEGKEKTGVFTGAYVFNQVTEKNIPVWISDFVLGNVGTGAVQGCPGHDKKDFAFAKKFDIPIVRVVVGPDGDTSPITKIEQVIEKGMPGTMVNSDFLNGLPFEEALEKTMDHFEKKGWGKRVNSYRLRDWVLSRQRYWGTPIPMVTCDDCGYVPVDEKDLPVQLPPLEDFLPADDGSSPLARAEDWVKTKCPKCDKEARRETDTMDTFVDSSWYHMRYADPKNKDAFADPKKLKTWMPVNLYTGGAEHTTMHLLYARFFTKALHSIGVIDFNEPYAKRRNHGMILGPDGNKMSKSKGNVIDPDKEVSQYGADTVRMYMAFLGPFDNFQGPWDPRGILGVHRFLHRVWKMGHQEMTDSDDADFNKELHKTIKAVGDDIELLHFNTAISKLMSLLNAMEKTTPSKDQFATFLQLLAPFAPHIAEEFWQGALENKESIHLESWPKYDESLITEDTVKIVVQINGKVRATLELPTGSDEATVTEAAKVDSTVQKHLTSEPKKTIYIQDKLINFVV